MSLVCGSAPYQLIPNLFAALGTNNYNASIAHGHRDGERTHNRELILGTGRKFSVQSQAGALLKEPVWFRRSSLHPGAHCAGRCTGGTRVFPLCNSLREARAALAYRIDPSEMRARGGHPLLCYAARDCRAVGHPAIELRRGADG